MKIIRSILCFMYWIDFLNYFQMLSDFMNLSVFRYQKEQRSSWPGMDASVREARLWQRVVTIGGAWLPWWLTHSLQSREAVSSAGGSDVSGERHHRKEDQRARWAVPGRGLRLVAEGGSCWAPVPTVGKWVPVPQRLSFEWSGCFIDTSRVHKYMLSFTSGRLTETCVCQALGKNRNPGPGPGKAHGLVMKAEREQTESLPVASLLMGGGVGTREGCAEEGALNRVFQRVLDCPCHPGHLWGSRSTGLQVHMEGKPGPSQKSDPVGPRGGGKAAPAPRCRQYIPGNSLCSSAF